MPIKGTGWELHIIRHSEQINYVGKRRTVGIYQVYHDGVAQTEIDFSGTMAETRGPGANFPAENHRRVEEGRYPLYTHKGGKYVTIGYTNSVNPAVKPKPGLGLKETGARTAILIHPGSNFLSSVGCLNPCTSLPNASEMIDFKPSRRRVISIIENLKTYIVNFPTKNGQIIPNACVVIDGEPSLELE